MLWTTLAFLFPIFLGAQTRAALPPDEAPPRVAVVPADINVDTRALVDLVSVRLATTTSVQMVERSVLDRVLAEQNLSAAGLADSGTQIKLGKMLRADGLVFVACDAERHRLSVRFVESRHGFQAGQWFYPLSDRTADRLAETAATDVIQAVSKLRLGIDGTLLVSIVGIANATLADKAAWDEEQTIAWLGTCFTRDPRILVLDRRQMADLLTETVLAPSSGTVLPGAAVVIDGEVALAVGEDTRNKAARILFRVRLRDPHMQEIAVVQTEGALDKPEPLATATAQAVLKKLQEIGPKPSVSGEGEADYFVRLASQSGSFRALDAALALGASNETTVAALVGMASRGAFDPRGRGRDEWLAKARETSKAVEVARRAKSASDRQAFAGTLCNKGILSQWFDPSTPEYRLLQPVRSDPEVRAILGPVRDWVRHEEEDRCFGSQKEMIWLLARHSGVYFESYPEQVMYLEGLLSRVLDAPWYTPDQRSHQVMRLLSEWVFNWETLEFLSRRPEPALRFFAYATMMDVSPDAERQREYARRAMEVPDAIPDTIRVLRATIRRKALAGRPDAVDFFNGTVHRLLAHCPDAKPRFASELFKAEMAILEEGDLDAHLKLRPVSLLPLLSPDDALALLDRAVVMEVGWVSTDRIAKFEYRRYPELRRSMLATHHPERLSGPRLMARQLLAREAPALGRMAPGLHDARGRRLQPGGLLLDGETLWTVLHQKDMTSSRLALIRMDLASGNVLSVRYGATVTAAANPIFYGDWMADILSLRRWGDWLCLADRHLGVVLVPAEPESGERTLAGVRILGNEVGLANQGALDTVGIGDDLYIAAPAAIVKWNRKTERTTVVVNESGQIDSNAVRGVTSLAADHEGRFLYAKGGWNHAHGLSGGFQQARATWRLDIAGNTWALIAGPSNAVPAGVPALPAAGDVGFAPQPYSNGFIGFAANTPDWSVRFVYDATNAAAIPLTWAAEVPVYDTPHEDAAADQPMFRLHRPSRSDVHPPPKTSRGGNTGTVP